ncbi:unnamed protein product [Durusdinium trenchii]|uniref:Uncharacterized protein n=1 Tax=Durusdinium trenchii TaxID=1381693 RepID=A0ABP0M8B2_9DINO
MSPQELWSLARLRNVKTLDGQLVKMDSEYDKLHKVMADGELAGYDKQSAKKYESKDAKVKEPRAGSGTTRKRAKENVDEDVKSSKGAKSAKSSKAAKGK